MLKASALYIAIIVAAIVAIFSASLIAAAWFYRWEQQKSQRMIHLSNNLESGINLVLSPGFLYTDTASLVDLYGEQNDSLSVQKVAWGLYDYAAVSSFIMRDTLRKTFFIAPDDINDQLAIYLSDEDRPLSLSGSTKINGDVLVPKAGVKQAYVEGKPYQGGKKLVNGNIKDSNRQLPPLNKIRLQEIEKWLDDSVSNEILMGDSISNSFFNSVYVLRVDRQSPVIDGVISGNVIILCDTVLRITATAQLQDVMVFAKGITVEDNFQGSCQLFARDSISVGKKVIFNYPSSLGVIKPADNKKQSRIQLGEDNVFSGILFSYEKDRSNLQTLIGIGKNSTITGEVYATGLLKMERPLTVHGKVSCNRFIIQTKTSLYENYLIDITLDRTKRSKYFLTSQLFDKKEGTNQVLKWLR